jgi:hypothetical protein
MFSCKIRPYQTRGSCRLPRYRSCLALFQGPAKSNTDQKLPSTNHSNHIVTDGSGRGRGQGKELEGLKAEIASVFANIRVNRPKPSNITLIENEPIDPTHWATRRYQVSFLVSWETKAAMVVKFPLKSQTHPAILEDKVKAEAGALMWARRHTRALPIPKVLAFDGKGSYLGIGRVDPF